MSSVTYNFGKKTQSAQQQDLIYPKLRKTKICSFFQEGRCRKGDKCGFAHGGLELELLPDLTKTSICLAWKEGTCPHSATQCRFAHGKHDLRAPPQQAKQSPGLQNHDDNSVGQSPDWVCPEFIPGLASHGVNAPLSPPPGIEQWTDCELEPMKVLSASPLRRPSDLEPMTVTPSFLGHIGAGLTAGASISNNNTLFSQWGHWEKDTSAGESSSDDDSSLSSAKVAPNFLQPHSLSTQHILSNIFSPSKSIVGGGMTAETIATVTEETDEMEGLDDLDMMIPSSLLGTMFEVDQDPIMDMPFGSKYSAAGSFGSFPSYHSPAEVSTEAPMLNGYSAFDGMPRLW